MFALTPDWKFIDLLGALTNRAHEIKERATTSELNAAQRVKKLVVLAILANHQI